MKKEHEVEEKFDASLKNLDLTCSKTWDLICSGNTLGCFQIESRLGKTTCKKAAPRTIEELSDVIAIIRPGCLEAKLDDGVSVTEHYIKRKTGQEPIEYLHESLKPILKDTYGLLIYQEQMMEIASSLAGFSLKESDDLRKAAGKKKVDLMQKIRSKFIEGCNKTGKIEEKDAITVFDWIEKSQRYSFNLAHSCAYALQSYTTAYAKTHYKIRFYRSYLNHAIDKQKELLEMSRLIEDAKKNDIEVRCLDIRNKNNRFIIKDNKIYYGISNLKSIGINAGKEIIDNIPEDIDLMNWTEVLFKFLLGQKKSAIKIMISVGAFDYLNVPRKKMLYEHNNCLSLKESEVLYIIENCDLSKDVKYCLADLKNAEIGKGKAISSKRRLETVNGIISSVLNSAVSYSDTIEEISAWEESYMGYSLTCSKFDNITLKVNDKKCLELDNIQHGTYSVVAQIRNVNEITTKNDEDMAFCTIADDSGSTEMVIFPDKWGQYGSIVKNFEILRFNGVKKEDSFILSKCYEV